MSAPFHLLLDRRGPLRSPQGIPYARGSQQLRMPTGGGPSRRRDGHVHERAVKASWRCNLRSNRIRNGCESIRHERSEGDTVNGIDERGPLTISTTWRPCWTGWGAKHPSTVLPGCATQLPATPFSVGFLHVNHVWVHRHLQKPTAPNSVPKPASSTLGVQEWIASLIGEISFQPPLGAVHQ